MSKPELLNRCSNILPGHDTGAPIADTLRELADSLDGSEYPDVYGTGEYIESFESDVAAMFGKAAAVFMPSGTMAQQIAIRIWCEQSGNPTIAMHPTSHLEFAEQLGYQYLHGIHRLQFGVPEFLGGRLLLLQDLKDLGKLPGAILLELPYRSLGGQLHLWEELVSISDWAKQNKIPLHMDGARIWQCVNFYQKSYAEIASLFDSLYVSFYKDLGGLCGCMLLGPDDFIKESRMWQRRHGGNLYTQAPFVASAKKGMNQRLDKMDSWVEKSREIAAILSACEGIIVNPDPPHVNMFRIFLKGNPEELTERHHSLAEETGTFLFHRLTAAPVPGFSTTEMHIWENGMQFDVSKLRSFMARLMD